MSLRAPAVEAIASLNDTTSFSHFHKIVRFVCLTHIKSFKISKFLIKFDGML